MSPARACFAETAVPEFACWYETRGRLIPTFRKTYCTNPEQSNPDGVDPPQTYGVPWKDCASRTILPAAPPASEVWSAWRGFSGAAIVVCSISYCLAAFEGSGE